MQQPDVNRLVAGLLLVTRAVLLLDGLQMLVVPVVLHRHLWNQLAGLHRRRRGGRDRQAARTYAVKERVGGRCDEQDGKAAVVLGEGWQWG